MHWTHNNGLQREGLSLGGITGTYSVSYGYDAAGRLESVNQGANGARFSYLANSPLVSQVTFKQGTTTRMTTTKQHDFLNRVWSKYPQPFKTDNCGLRSELNRVISRSWEDADFARRKSITVFRAFLSRNTD